MSSQRATIQDSPPAGWIYRVDTHEMVHTSGLHVGFDCIGSLDFLDACAELGRILSMSGSGGMQLQQNQKFRSTLQAYQNQAYQNQAYQNQAYQNQNQNYIGQGGTGIKAKTDIDYRDEDMRMVSMRMRWPNGSPFPFLEIFRLEDKSRVIFLIANDQPVTLQDDGTLFPSDRLIAQLRLLQGAIGE